MNTTVNANHRGRIIMISCIFIGIIILSMFTSHACVAKSTLNYQHVTVERKTIPLKQLFKIIKKQTGYDVIWQPGVLNSNEKIFADFNNTSLTAVIEKCIAGKDLKAIVKDQTIIITSKTTNKSISHNYLSNQDSLVFKGRVLDEKGRALAGVTVKLLGSTRATYTTGSGDFQIYAPKGGTLLLSYIGYNNQQITLKDKVVLTSIEVKMVPGQNNLGEVNIVSNGYQTLNKERAPGSFELVTKEQLQLSSSPNLISRLEGITTSLDFRNDLNLSNSTARIPNVGNLVVSPTLANLTIRGRNTLNDSNLDYMEQSGTVLVVIDGVPSPYSIDNINPNDVEDISILKDAAAASIWGARAANGVIVVKTKRGSFNKKISVFYNSNFNLTEKFDLFYRKRMSTSEYIDAQAFIFGASNASTALPNINFPTELVSPVQEILIGRNRGEITYNQANSALDALRGHDIRNDFEKYLLRNSLVQNHTVGIDGGSVKQAYRLSVGYDKLTNNTVGSEGSRFTANYNTTLKITEKLDLSGGISFIRSTTQDQPGNFIIRADVAKPFFLYTKLADENGTPLAIPFRYRPGFLDILNSTYGSVIQDLSYVPLNDLKQGFQKTLGTTLNFNVNANYKFFNWLSGTVLYNYSYGNNRDEILNRVNSFYMRELITRFTKADGTKQLPYGGQRNLTYLNSKNHTLRGQLNIDKSWGRDHVINGVIGLEAIDVTFLRNSNFYLGYDEETRASNMQLNFADNLPFLFRGFFFQQQGRLPYFNPDFYSNKERNLGTYANGAYTYKSKYTLSGSIRRDYSNAFGVGTNKGGAPFYSLGALWNVANESFYKVNWLPRLQLRASFGYNGNANNMAIARALITMGDGIGDNGLQSASVGSAPTNNLLRPEKTRVINFGVNFGSRNNRISGSVEYYTKNTTDLIAGNLVDPSTGFDDVSFNTASLKARGIDFTVNSENLQAGLFSWSSNLLFSYNRVKVTDLFSAAADDVQQLITGRPQYNVGADLSRVYAFRWAGLDHATGHPMGYLNGAPFIVSNPTNYLAIATPPASEARYFGSAVPVYFGSLRNTFRYGQFSISANLLYKFGYYARRQAIDMVNYTTLFSVNQTVQPAEYSNRWQKPGDELRTNVPSMIYPGNNFRDQFYQYAEINVYRADHIRLQQVNLSYTLTKKGWIIKNPRIYANVSNLGILWRANKLGIDPETADYPNPRTYALGLSANF